MAVTLLQLRDRARVRANQDDSDFPTDAQYTQYVNEARKDVFADLIIAGYPVNHETTTITANGASTYPVAGSLTPKAPVFSVVGVYAQLAGTVYELARMNPGDRAALLSNQAQGQAPSRFYEVRADFTSGVIVEILPAPTSGTYLVDWIAGLEDLSLDADEWLGPNSSDELVVISAARKAVLKEGRVQDAAVLRDEYESLLDKVKRLGSWLDQRNPAQIRRANPFGSDQRAPFDFDVMGPGYDY